MQVCTSLQTYNHASTSPLSFLQAGCPSCRPTNSIKALKAIQSGDLADSKASSGLGTNDWELLPLYLWEYFAAVDIGNESLPIQFTQCWFPWLAISSAKIPIYSDKIYESSFIEQHSEIVMVWNYQNADCSLKKINSLSSFVSYGCSVEACNRCCAFCCVLRNSRRWLCWFPTDQALRCWCWC